MGTKIRIPPGKFQVHDIAEVGNGWSLYTYEPGTAFATPKATYQDKDGLTPHANPIVFDSRGEADIWWDGLYDIKLFDASSNLVWSMTDVGQGAFEGEARTGPQATTHNMTSDADYTLTSSQEGYGRIIITDTLTNLTTGRNIVCSTDEKGYYFQNDTAQTLTLKTSAGTGIAVPAGSRRLLFCDGTNVVRAFVQSEIDSVTITPASDADVTITSAQAEYGRLILVDGAWTVTHNIIVPAQERTYHIDNSAGTYAATVKTSAGTGISVPAGERRILDCDGTNVIDPETGLVTTAELTSQANSILQGGTVYNGTPQATTSGTTIDFSSIPTWAKEITFMMYGVSTNGTNEYLVQIGDATGGLASSGYVASGGYLAASPSVTTVSSGFIIKAGSAANVYYGAVTIRLVDAATYKYVIEGSAHAASGYISVSAGGVTLSGLMDRLRFTTVGSTDTFDAGAVNIQYK